MRASWLGSIDYDKAFEQQKELWQSRLRGTIEDTLLLLEHPHTITVGRGADLSNLLVTEAELGRLGCKLRFPDRGGDITYHGPGQLVAYPVIDLGSPLPDLDRYLRDLEEVIIDVLSTFGVRGRRVPGATGVWTSRGKIASIGVKVTRGVTMHGFSINVAPDLAWYERIVSCGLMGKKTTSIKDMSGEEVSMPDIVPEVVSSFERIFMSAAGAAETAGTHGR